MKQTTVLVIGACVSASYSACSFSLIMQIQFSEANNGGYGGNSCARSRVLNTCACPHETSNERSS